MANSTMFEEEEINNIKDLKRGPDFIEVKCGCTSKKYGDNIGKLKIFTNGQFVIDCVCTAECREENMTPFDFEKHSAKEGKRKWTHHIWVSINEQKVPLHKTVLLKYYKHASNEVSASCRGKRIFHRDEFVRCSRCKKERRFHMRTKEECRIYHDAVSTRRWKCVNSPYEITCDVEEERGSRKSCRGCPRLTTCEGCTSCVCVGCLKCRFRDCDCRTCVDFMQNAEP